jgi:hypothetical protein
MAPAAKRRPLTNEERVENTRLAHACLLSSIAKSFDASGVDAALHGGAALYMRYNLPRLSSDMDFVIARDDLPALERAVATGSSALLDWYRAKGLDAKVVLTGKTKGEGEVTRYKASLSLDPQIIGDVHIHLEFWPVAREYVGLYEKVNLNVVSAGADWAFPVRFRFPDPVAAMSDKLIALVSRPHLKWRDLYDLAYMTRDFSDVMAPHDVFEAVPRHLDAYQFMTIDQIRDRVSSLLALDEAALIEMARKDLLRYLSPEQQAVVEASDYGPLRHAVKTVRSWLQIYDLDLKGRDYPTVMKMQQ